MHVLSNLKYLPALLLGFIVFSCGQENSNEQSENAQVVELTPIQKERASMHEDFVATVKYHKLEKHLKYLSKKSFDECTWREAERRIQFAWRLGKVDQLKVDIPAYLNSEIFNTDPYSKLDWRIILHLYEHVPSEWATFIDMADELYDHFKKTGDLQSEQKMLGIKIQGAHLMGDSLNERNT